MKQMHFLFFLFVFTKNIPFSLAPCSPLRLSYFPQF